MKPGTSIKLNRTWILGDQIGRGGFAPVHAVTGGDEEAVAKLVPQEPGASRELLFVDVGGARNVVPVIDHGEHDGFWVLVMPRASMSLRERLEGAGGHLDLPAVVRILTDICVALEDLSGKIVHRDLKPENVLLLGDHWCLADFGIARYAEASTSLDTRKFAMTPPYAAPEQWKAERATPATDIYAFGVMAFEMIAGRWPFPGPRQEDFRDQHLRGTAPSLSGVPAAFASLVAECLYKAPQARPPAANIRARLAQVPVPPASSGLAKLEEANREEVRRHAEADRLKSEAQLEAERRDDLFTAANAALDQIGTSLQTAITGAAPAAVLSPGKAGGWSLKLNRAELTFSAIKRTASGVWGRYRPAMDVIASGEIKLKIPQDQTGYTGREHSLWYADPKQAGVYGWYETAFMVMPLMTRPRPPEAPFSLDPGEEAGRAIGSGMADFSVAWPFTPLVTGDLDDFISRWAEWFANAAMDRLGHPSQMPERNPDGSWRRG